jgi:hypothetical protein
LPGAPFDRLDFQWHSEINVDPFVRIRMPAGKWHGGSPAVFGHAQFEILIVWRSRSGMPSGQVMMFTSGVKSLIGFPDDSGDIGNQMLCEFLECLVAHLTQSTWSSGQLRHGDPARRPKYGEHGGKPSPSRFLPP